MPYRRPDLARTLSTHDLAKTEDLRSFAFFLSPFPILKNTSSSVSFGALPYDDVFRY